ncbi:MAG: DNA-directed DNA polymerase [Candidatus Diapherotrites archaeon]
MVVKTTKALLLDADYINEDGKSIIRLFVRNKDRLEIFKDAEFHPYFYAVVNDAKKAVNEIKEMVFGENSKVRDAKIIEKKSGNTIKVSFNLVQELIHAREKITELSSVIEKHEYDIPFAERYLIDKMLEPMNGIEIKSENGLIKSVKSFDSDFDFKLGAFDLETYSKGRFSDPKKDRILMASYADGKDDVVFTDKKAMSKIKYVKVFESEKQMIEKLIEKIKKENLDLLVTYNGDSFDIPYLTERAHLFKLKADLGSDGSEPKEKRMGMNNAVQLRGVQHFDAYRLMRMLGRFAVVDLIKYDLESVNQKIFGEAKEKITAENITKFWDTEKELKRLADYNLEDSKVTLKLAKEYLPLIIEICKLVKLPVFMVNRSSASTLVERLLLNKCFETETLVPNRPEGGVVNQRLMQSYSGGFVREPRRGLHENIAVLDFSSLHPTIIISHNISPETLNCEHKECKKNESPTGQCFCTKKEGFLSSILQDLFNRRMEIKKKLKTIDKKDKKYNILNARQLALKIILNSFYGYLGYARSRWYSRECAQAVTSWSQHYVKWVGNEADKEGFETIYADTDSAFLLIKDKTQKDVTEFVKKINTKLPGIMNLDLQGFYKRGLFVTKREGTGAAKKRYALIDEKDNLKIVGFEYVRRDWSGIAKETQKSVIEAVLKEGKPERAVKIVRDVVDRLKKGKVPNKELLIYTQIKRPLAKYDAIGPHVAAARKAIARGKTIDVGSVIEYVITKSGKSISDKAELVEFVKEGNYDADYYIGHQVIPAVIRILAELGYNEQDLIQGGKQHTLNSFC